MQNLKGMIYTDKMCFEAGEIAVEGDFIARITLCAEEELTQKEAETYLLPGLVDIHFHGCMGYDFCDGTKEALRGIASYEMKHGITTICPATMTLPEEELLNICAVCADAVLAEVLEQNIALGEVLKGIYLEGPFLSLEKRGAQNPAFIHKADQKMLKRLQQAAKGMIKIVTIAPETEGAMACIRACGEDFRFSIAHTTADYETAKEAIQAGAAHITHLYNAMLPFTHRQPGVIGAAAEETQTRVELICDGVHIHPNVVRNTFRWFGAQRVVLISDSMMATGMLDGEYALGGQPVQVKGSLALLSDGTIAGSVTNLYDCMRTAVQMGVPKEEAVRAATCNPAVSVGLEEECGSLRAGRRADILIADKELSLRGVMKCGRMVVREG